MAAGWQQHAFTGGSLFWKPRFAWRFVPRPWNLNKHPENVLFVKQQRANKWGTRSLVCRYSTVHFPFGRMYASLLRFPFKRLKTAGTSVLQKSIHLSVHLPQFFFFNAMYWLLSLRSRECVTFWSSSWKVLLLQVLVISSVYLKKESSGQYLITGTTWEEKARQPVSCMELHLVSYGMVSCFSLIRPFWNFDRVRRTLSLQLF